MESSNEAAGTAAGAAGRTPGPDRDPRLWELADRYWSLVLADEPLAATLLGVHDHDDRIGDLSESVEEEQRSWHVEKKLGQEAFPVAKGARQRPLD